MGVFYFIYFLLKSTFYWEVGRAGDLLFFVLFLSPYFETTKTFPSFNIYNFFLSISYRKYTQAVAFLGDTFRLSTNTDLLSIVTLLGRAPKNKQHVTNDINRTRNSENR